MQGIPFWLPDHVVFKKVAIFISENFYEAMNIEKNITTLTVPIDLSIRLIEIETKWPLIFRQNIINLVSGYDIASLQDWMNLVLHNMMRMLDLGID